MNYDALVCVYAHLPLEMVREPGAITRLPEAHSLLELSSVECHESRNEGYVGVSAKKPALGSWALEGKGWSQKG